MPSWSGPGLLGKIGKILQHSADGYLQRQLYQTKIDVMLLTQHGKAANNQPSTFIQSETKTTLSMQAGCRKNIYNNYLVLSCERLMNCLKVV